jgi:2-dehydropantoate 2-reductase
MLEAAVTEGVHTASAEGIDIDQTKMVERTRETCRKTADNICSMLQDVRGGRKTEIESITGEVIRIAEAHGVEVPVNKKIYNEIKKLIYTNNK